MTDPARSPYAGTDLTARRAALGLRREDVAELLELDPAKYRQREEDTRSISTSLLAPLLQMQQLVDQIITGILGDATVAPQATLMGLTDSEEFATRYHARTRTGRPWPATLHQVAAGRAAAILTREGRPQDISLDDGRHGDLLCRRQATGLLKAEAGRLLGFTEGKWAVWERGSRPAPRPIVAELQAIDDFITATASELEVQHDSAGTYTITVARHGFDERYPSARTIRDHAPYPRRLERIAAARRAADLAATESAPLVLIRER